MKLTLTTNDGLVLAQWNNVEANEDPNFPWDLLPNSESAGFDAEDVEREIKLAFPNQI